MRSRGFQFFLLIIVFGGIVLGLTFARQFSPSPMPQRRPTVNGVNLPKSFITFGGTTLAGINYEMKPARGHQDLWFENNKDEDLELGLDQTSCKCSGVEVTLLTPQETEKLQNWLPVAAATQWAAGSGGFLPETATASLLQQSVRGIFEDGSRWEHLLRADLNPKPFHV